MATELKAMGAEIIEKEEMLIIRQKSLKGASLYSHRDHRIAMALTAAALGAEGQSEIRDLDCIAKTYPGFIQAMQQIGAHIVTKR